MLKIVEWMIAECLENGAAFCPSLYPSYARTISIEMLCPLISAALAQGSTG
jgi:hypothetical protein